VRDTVLRRLAVRALILQTLAMRRGKRLHERREIAENQSFRN
jgi:hypothetical protein